MAHLHDGAVGPKPLADFFTQHHLAGMLQQHDQDAEWLFLKTNLKLAFTQFRGAKVEFKLPKTDDSNSSKRPGGRHTLREYDEGTAGSVP